jgi:hypothetical protein
MAGMEKINLAQEKTNGCGLVNMVLNLGCHIIGWEEFLD